MTISIIPTLHFDFIGLATVCRRSRVCRRIGSHWISCCATRMFETRLANLHGLECFGETETVDGHLASCLRPCDQRFNCMRYCVLGQFGYIGWICHCSIVITLELSPWPFIMPFELLAIDKLQQRNPEHNHEFQFKFKPTTRIRSCSWFGRRRFRNFNDSSS